MNRIKKIFQNKSEKLIPFITAGYPDLNSTVELALAAADAGADMIEIGIPFSDPLADGPVIQESSRVALKNGIDLNLIFEQIISIREKTDIPLTFMGYINPIYKYGIKKFLDRCNQVGIDGIILPDLPLEEADMFCHESHQREIAPILLVAPNTKSSRIEIISKKAEYLIYAVSILGVTGNELSSKQELEAYFNRLRQNSTTPFVVGFGIRNRQDVQYFNRYADGAVVGTAILQQLKSNEDNRSIMINIIQKLRGQINVAS